jgi:outer membrane protein OmpA-like peptidoglycan-associated protein
VNDLLEQFDRKSDGSSTIRLENIQFYGGRDLFLPESIDELKFLLDVMKQRDSLKIEIQGHICCKGPNEIEGISGSRARAIYNFLVVNKIDRKRLTFKGYGVTRPIHAIPEKNAQEEEDNRRVEIMIIAN